MSCLVPRGSSGLKAAEFLELTSLMVHTAGEGVPRRILQASFESGAGRVVVVK